MANRVDGTPGVAISYVVANPSSYAWPTAMRPLPSGDADPTDAYREALGDNGAYLYFAGSTARSTSIPPLPGLAASAGSCGIMEVEGRMLRLPRKLEEPDGNQFTLHHRK